MSLGHNMPRDEDRGIIPHSVKDTRTIGSAYERYLQSVQTSSMPSEEAGPFKSVGIGRPGGNNKILGPPMVRLWVLVS
ncbi:Nuclear speckle RNA-binding protein B [Cardamine amara subsp. amara]|uniref:Nuclear speckle RNA-binding protein B n=1 Tax=Cardamine amara subsp. amara TaxID=228776 RepID=A0ABD0ZEC4_CARAN